MMTAFGSIPAAVEAMRLGRVRLHAQALQRAADPPDRGRARWKSNRSSRKTAHSSRRLERLSGARNASSPLRAQTAALLERRGAGGRQRRHRAAYRRKRHRQESARPPYPSAKPAQGRAVRQRRLHHAERASAGKRAVRPRAGRVHRRDQGQAGTAGGGGGRHGLSRRDWRPVARPAGQAAALSAGEDFRARRRQRDPRRSTRASSPRPTRTSNSWSRKSAFARICITGSM